MHRYLRTSQRKETITIKRITSLLIVLLLAFASIAAAQDGDPLETVESYIESGFDVQYVADDVVVYDNAYAVTYEGLPEYQSRFAPFYRPDVISDYNVEITETYNYGNQVVADIVYSPAGVDVPITMTGVYEVEDGVITGVNYYYDPTPFVDTYAYEPVPSEFNFFGNEEEMVERIEDNPLDYLGELVTVSGYVEEIVSEDAFTLRDTEPFDLTPAAFMVAGGSENFYTDHNIDINLGQQVQVTGTLVPLDPVAIEAEAGYPVDALTFERFNDDSFGLVASYINVLNPVGGFENAQMIAEPDAGENLFGMPEETVELIEDDPDEFYGETVTVSGEIETIVTEDGFLMQDTEPFDLTPADFVVVDPTGDIFEEFDFTPVQGMRVQVTGTLYDFDLGELEGRMTWGFAETGFAEFTGLDNDDFALIAEDVSVITAE